MRLSLSIASVALLSTAVLAESPYVPQRVDCPDNFQFVRPATALSDGELDFLDKRDEITREALIDWLKQSNMSDFDPEDFLSNQTIRIGLAFSGGGYRAMLSGAGMLAALDDRTPGATGNGQLGGFLQATTYLAGLSGGNWLVGSVAVNNFSSIDAIQSSGNLWNLKHSLINPGGVNILKTFGYWDTIIDDVDDKQDAGFNVSLTDLWGRGLGYQMFNSTKGGQSLPYSGIRDYDVFKNAEMPFPIHVADRRSPGEMIISLNSSVFEFNPLEIGSWDPNIYHFADLKYIGTTANNGEVNGTCVVGYDNVGFMIGTSATLFNQFLLRINGTGVQGDVRAAATHILTGLSDDSNDVSIYSPNPFYGIPDIDQNDEIYLDLVDGGEDNQNIPLVPLYQPQRNVDFIMAFDNSADTDDYWPAGTSLMYTYRRQFGSQGNGTHFPYVPDNNTFLYNGYTEMPVFFGCDLQNLSSLYPDNTLPTWTENGTATEDGSNIPPVVAYIANSAHSFYSNASTFRLSYSETARNGMIENGFNVMTQNNGTLDSEWRACIGCATVLREQQRRGQSPTEQCQQCLSKYCWDGSIYNGDLTGEYSRRDGQSNLVEGVKIGSTNAAPKSTASIGVILVSIATLIFVI